MSYTASCHNGTKVKRSHNRRQESVVRKEKHIDLTRPHENWIDIDHKKAYEQIFGDAVKEYNAKQKRADRKIDDYYTHVKKDAKKNPVYEMIVHIGNMDNHPDEQLQKEIYWEYIQDWQRRNPNMKLVGVYYHADEQGNSHLHVDYVPVGTQYKKGLKIQNGLNQALKEQGFETKGRNETAQMQWQFSEREYLRQLCREYGLDMDEERVGESRGKKSLDRETYIAKQQRDEAVKETVEAEQKRDAMQNKIDELNVKGKAMVNKYNTMIDKVEDKQIELDELEDGIKKASSKLNKILDTSEQALKLAVDEIPGYGRIAQGIVQTIDTITRAVRDDDYER